MAARRDELHATSIFWTPGMERQFKSRRGYDMTKCAGMAQARTNLPTSRVVDKLPAGDNRSAAAHTQAVQTGPA